MNSFKTIPCFKLADLSVAHPSLLDISNRHIASSPDHFAVNIVSILNTSRCLKLRFSHKISKLLLVPSPSQRNLLLILFEDGSLLASEFAEKPDRSPYLTDNNFRVQLDMRLHDVDLDAKHDSTQTSVLLRSPQFSALVVINCHGSVPSIIVRNLPFGLTVIHTLFLFLEACMPFTSQQLFCGCRQQMCHLHS
jgi:hypothetical protein